jgi:protein gp37
VATNSHIEWTDATWNPVTGCTKVSPGCKNCYAARLAHRLQAMGQSNYRDGIEVTLQPQMLELPLRWKTPKRIFINSMSDLFHENVPTANIQQVFATMRNACLGLSDELDWAPQIWMGVSVESGKFTRRIDDLRKTAAHIKFLSLEPLLGSLLSLNLSDIDWAIVGGESGPGARPVDSRWVTDIRDQCLRANVSFFLSSGVASAKRQRVGCWKAERGIRCLLGHRYRSLLCNWIEDRLDVRRH